MHTVYKYRVIEEDNPILELPVGAVILSAQTQKNRLQVWALIDPTEQKTEIRNLRVAGTGHFIHESVDKLKFIDTVQEYEGSLILHVFEVLP